MNKTIWDMFQEFIDKGNIPSDLEEILKDDIKQDLEKIVNKIDSWNEIWNK